MSRADSPPTFLRCPQSLRRRALAALPLLLVLLVPSWLGAQQPVREGAEFTVNTTTGGMLEPSAAMTPAGEFVVVWHSYLTSSLQGRRFSSTGEARGAEFHVGSAHRYPWPDVSMDDAGDFAVVWKAGTSISNIALQRLDGDGALLGSELQVSSAERYIRGAAGATDSDGNLVVVWGGVDYPFWNVRGRMVDSSGSPAGGEFVVAPMPSIWLYPVIPDVARSASGEFVVVWQDQFYANSILARRFDSGGHPIGNEIQVSADNSDPRIAMNASGAFVVVWEGGGFYDPSITARRFDSTGSPVGAQFQVGAPGTFYTITPQAPEAAMDILGNFVVAWEVRYIQPQFDLLIHAMAFDSTGAPMGVEFQVDSDRSPFAASATPAMDDSGNFVVAWQDGDYIGIDIRAQRFTLDVTPPNQPPVADAGSDATVECTSPGGAGVVLNGLASSDPDSTDGTHDDIVQFEWFVDFGLPTELLLGEGEILDVGLGLGTHAVTLRVTDSAGETATDEVMVGIVDTTPPLLSVEISPETLWPPNHRLRKVTATVTASDTCSTPVVLLVSVTSSEPDNAPGAGDGSTSRDIRGAVIGEADVEFLLRAERQGDGPGRTYTVVYSATDGAGLAATASEIVFVPHDRGLRSRTPGGESPEGRLGSGTRARPGKERLLPERPPE